MFHVCVRNFLQTIGCLNADRHGAVVIPDTVIPNLKSSIEKVFASEAVVIGPARQPGFDIHKLEEAWAESEKART